MTDKKDETVDLEAEIGSMLETAEKNQGLTWRKKVHQKYQAEIGGGFTLQLQYGRDAEKIYVSARDHENQRVFKYACKPTPDMARAMLWAERCCLEHTAAQTAAVLKALRFTASRPTTNDGTGPGCGG